MVSATTNALAASSANTIFSGVTSSASSASFAQQLAAALEQCLSQSGNGSQLEIEVQPASRQDSDSGQYIVTVTKPQNSQPSSSTSASSTDPTPATQGTSSDSPDSGMVTIPFGTGTITVPTLATELANHNAEAANMNLSPAAIEAEDALTEQGDPWANMTIPGTNLSWESLTQNQQIAYMYAMDYGMPAGESMQDYLAANVGPQTMANAPNADPTMFGTS
jgi:hypothetical protein